MPAVAARPSGGRGAIVPEIVSYELRRELLRLRNAAAIRALTEFNAMPGRYLPITTPAMELAADLWARTRSRGKPTAHPYALDVDVILAAQVLTSGIDAVDVVVATSNLEHLGQFVPAELWSAV